MEKNESKNINEARPFNKYDRFDRIARLLILTNAYNNYALMIKYAKSAEFKSTYEEAELISTIANLLTGKNTSPKDFILNREEACNRALEHYEYFQKWVKAADSLDNVSSKAAHAFCKSVEHNMPTTILKFKHIVYPFTFTFLLQYILGNISKEELERSAVDVTYGLKVKKISLAETRRVIIEIEELYQEVYTKQINRSIS